MTTFPALIPSSRTFTPGEYPATAFSAFSGVQNRVRHSNVLIAAQLQLSFIGLPEADMLAIWQHYANRQGAFKSFALPAEIVSNSSITDYVPDIYLWRYTGPGVVEDLPCGGHNVTLTLETVPPSPASAGGADLRVVLALAAGAGAAGEYVAGITESVALSISTGAAVIAQNGVFSTVALSLAAGAAQGDVSVAGINWNTLLILQAGSAQNLGRPGINQTITLSLVPGAADGGAATDPDFSSVSLLLPFDGANGATTFADASSNAFTITTFGSASLVTADKVFGSASLEINGSGAYIESPANSAFQLGTGNFTVEMWVKPYRTDGNDGLFTFGNGLCLSIVSGTWTLGTTGSGGINAGAAVANEWAHIAVVRIGIYAKFFIDGNQPRGDATWIGVNFTQDKLTLGWYANSSFRFRGLVDDLRVTKGVARYTANFTPPTAPFPNS
jgi:hypothetical protein